MHTPHDNDTQPLGFRLKLVHRLLTREVRAQMAAAGPEASDRRDEIVAGVHSRVAGAVPAEDFDVLLRSLDAIARELGWDESQPMPRREGRGHRRGPFGHGFSGGFPHPGFVHGEPGRFGHHERHGHHGRGCGHGHNERRGFAQHPAVAEAFERGFTRGYEQAQRD